MMAAASAPHGDSRLPPAARTALWLAAYVVVVAAPLFALLPDATTPGAGFVWDFAMALGYAPGRSARARPARHSARRWRR